MRKHILIASFLLLTFSNASAQKQRQARMDSLLTELPRVPNDSVKLQLFLDIIATYNEFNQAQALSYEEPALALAKKLKSKEGEGDVLNVIGRVLWRKGLFGEARNYHLQAQQIFNDLGDQKKVALCVRYIGQDYADEGNYTEALKKLSEALDMYTRQKDLKRMSYIHSLIQWVQGKQGDYANAAKSGYTALKILEGLGDKNGMVIVLSDIAENYIYIGNFPAALKYLMKGSEVYRAKGDCVNVAYNYNLIGTAYRSLRDYQRSSKCYLAALRIGQEINDFNIIAKAYEGIAEVYMVHHEYGNALTNYKFSAQGFYARVNKRDLSRVYCKIGECYITLGQYEQAKKYFDDAFTLSKELKSRSALADYYHGMERLDSVTGNWRSAYINHKKYTSTRDSIFNEENISKIVQMDLIHEFDIKEATAKAEQETKDFEQRIESISLTIISLLILLLAIVFYRSQKRKARVNQELQLKSIKLEEENREKTSILNIVSHDLKAPFNKIKGLTDLIALSNDMTPEQKAEYIAHIRSAVDQGTYLIRNLLEAENVNSASNKPAFIQIDVWSFIRDFQMDLNGQLLKKQQKVVTDIEDEGRTLTTDKQMLTRILDNLLSNASKFSEPGKSIFLRVWSDKVNINFSVRDQGPGISEADQKLMFRKFQQLSARPTAGEGSTGLGLSIAKALVDKLGGTIDVSSKLGEGTEFVVSLPA